MAKEKVSAKIDPQSKARLQELVAAGDFSSLSSAIDRVIALGLSAYDGESMESTLRRILREELSHINVQQTSMQPSNPKMDKLLKKTRR